MDIIKSFKVRMHMNYSEYEAKLKENPDLMTEILGNFITDMTNGPLDEVIRFFNLEDEDKEGLTESNFAIGYKIVGQDAEKKVLAINIRLDIRVPEEENTEEVPEGMPPIPEIPGMPNVAEMLASGIANSENNSVDAVVDTEGEVVMEDTIDSTAEEAPAEKTTEEPVDKPIVEETPVEDAPTETAEEESEWHDADPEEVPFETEDKPVEE